MFEVTGIEMNHSYAEKIVEIIAGVIGTSDYHNLLSNLDAPLTGKELGLSSIDLVYLFFEIERRFEINIEPDLLDEYGFLSVNMIARILTREIGG